MACEDVAGASGCLFARFRNQIARCVLSSSQHEQQQQLQLQQQGSLTVPWVECLPDVCLVYVPLTRVLEVNVTTHAITRLPDSVCIRHGISVPPPRQSKHLISELSSHARHCAALATRVLQAVSQTLGGQDMDAVSREGVATSISAVGLKVCSLVKATPVTGSPSLAEQWFHVDIDDPTEFSLVKEQCPFAASLVDHVLAAVILCNRYLETIRANSESFGIGPGTVTSTGTDSDASPHPKPPNHSKHSQNSQYRHFRDSGPPTVSCGGRWRR